MTSVADSYPQMLRDAFTVLDHYCGDIAKRDPVKSLNEDRCELLGRLRVALDPLIFDREVRRDDVADIVQRIDNLLATECASRAAVPHMYPVPADWD